MSQTILALGALALMGLVSFGHQRARMHDQEGIVRHEVEIAAQGLAAEVFETLDLLPFDEVSTRNADALTPEANFGLAQDSVGLDDLVDLDDIDEAVIRFDRLLKESGCTGACTVSLDAEAVVGYVAEQSGSLVATGGTPAFAKEVTLTITSARLPAPIVMSRVYTPGWISE